MAIAFKWQNNTYGASTATSVAVAKGANTISAGDLLIAVVAVSKAADPGAITPPSGWTEITSGTITGNTFNSGALARTGLFYRVANGTEGSSFTFSWTTTSISSWALIDYTGASSTPFDGGAKTDYNSTLTASLIAPAITTTNINDFEIFVWASYSQGTFTMPGVVTTRINQAGATAANPWIGVADLSIPSSGSQATRTVNQPNQELGYVAESFGIKPMIIPYIRFKQYLRR